MAIDWLKNSLFEEFEIHKDYERVYKEHFITRGLDPLYYIVKQYFQGKKIRAKRISYNIPDGWRSTIERYVVDIV
jgi:hypothetical protein